MKKQIRKHGQGYGSGKYTAAQAELESDAEDVPPAPTSSRAPLTDIHTDSEEEIQSPTTTLAEEGTDSCDICGYKEGEGIVGIRLGMALPAGDFLWVAISVSNGFTSCAWE